MLTISPLFVDRFYNLEFDKEAISDGYMAHSGGGEVDNLRWFYIFAGFPGLAQRKTLGYSLKIGLAFSEILLIKDYEIIELCFILFILILE